MKIGFLAFHPGAVNTMTKVINELKKNEECSLFFYPFLEYAVKEWDLEDNTAIFKDSIEFFDLLNKDLDVLLYSSAAGSIVEEGIPEFCRKHKIKSISTIDVFWIDEEEIKRRFKSKPDIIITPEMSILEMIEGFNWDGVEVYNLGNPHLEIKRVQRKKRKNKELTLNFISFPNGNDILCETDPMAKVMIKEIAEVISELPNVKKMYISNHPRERIKPLEELIESLENKLSKKLEINPYKSTDECCENCDVIVGYSSTVLYEQLLKGQNVMFYENKSSFKVDLENNKFKEVDFKLPENCSEKIVELIMNNRKK